MFDVEQYMYTTKEKRRLKYTFFFQNDKTIYIIFLAIFTEVMFCDCLSYYLYAHFAHGHVLSIARNKISLSLSLSLLISIYMERQDFQYRSTYYVETIALDKK